MAKCPTCGHEKRSARSLADHRRFFAIINNAFANWPESHPEQFDSAERLRHWLLIKAGYREVDEVDAEFLQDEPATAKLLSIAIEGAMRSAPVRPFVRVHGDRVALFWPKSIKFETLDQKQFGPIREAVEHVIEIETGMKAADLLVEAA